MENYSYVKLVKCKLHKSTFSFTCPRIGSHHSEGATSWPLPKPTKVLQRVHQLLLMVHTLSVFSSGAAYLTSLLKKNSRHSSKPGEHIIFFKSSRTGLTVHKSPYSLPTALMWFLSRNDCIPKLLPLSTADEFTAWMG